MRIRQVPDKQDDAGFDVGRPHRFTHGCKCLSAVLEQFVVIGS
jgi:hypothetical protein